MSEEKKLLPFVAWLQWFAIFAILGAIVAGNYLYSDYSLLYRSLIALGMVLVAGGILYTTPQGYNLFRLAMQARIELSRVVWPNRPEMVQTFIAVMAVVAIVMLLLWLMDSMFSWLAFLLLG